MNAAPQHALIVKTAIGSIIRRFEFECEGVKLLSDALVNDENRASLVKFNEEIAAAIERLKGNKA